MGTCLDRGIKVVSNAGGLDPDSVRRRGRRGRRRRSASRPRIAYVDGDDLLPRLDELRSRPASTLPHLETGEPIGDVSRFVTANAYLGCFGIVEALERGADIVITGRVTDAALVCGPAAWHHGWRRDNFDALAGAVVAGHVVECGAQVTGGNYSFFSEVPGMERVGFPWVEVADDGSSVVGKHDGTGGEVSVGTVTSQLLYEIAVPSYLGPDVTARFDTIRLEQIAPDRVRISGREGEAPPSDAESGDERARRIPQGPRAWRLTGLDIEEKARLVEAAFWRACPFSPEEFDSVTSRLIRTDKSDPSTNEEAVATWRLTLKDHDERKVGRGVADAVVELALASVPGFFIPGSAPSAGSPYGVYRPSVVPSNLVPQYVTVLGAGRNDHRLGRSVYPRPTSWPTKAPASNHPEVRRRSWRWESSSAPDRATKAATRTSGLRAKRRGLRLARRLPERRRAAPSAPRNGAPGHRSLSTCPPFARLTSFIHDLLDEGVAASTRQDAQAKGLGEWLRSRYVEMPTALLHS